jgi:hypothetical protein
MMRRLFGAVLGFLVLSCAPALAAPAYLDKLDSHVQELAAGKGWSALEGNHALGGPTVAPGGRVLVDVYVNGDVDAAAQRLRALGMEVTAVSRRAPERLVEGLLPIGAADEVAALGSTHAVLSVSGFGTDAGSVLSQGDAAHRGPQARALGATGAGVTVGVMSDSIDKVGGGIAASQLTGDLPATVTDLGDSPTGSDEGRAMAEIIYDEAPGITHMVFDTGSGGGATKASHILALAGAGARVIADDTFYLTEPFFQDGVVSRAVDQVKSEGVAYIASAGNRARQSWEGTFAPGAGGYEDFGGGDTEQTVATVPSGRGILIALQWNEPWGHAETNLDLYLRNAGTNALLDSSTTENIGGYPIEYVEWVNATGSPVTVAIQIHRTAGSGTPQMKYIAHGNFGAFGISEHATGSPAINPDAAAANGSLAAAAVCWSQTAGPCLPLGLQTPETFSSRGPLTRTRNASGALLSSPEVRQKPNLAGADGVATSVPGFSSFFGTSAAAPSIAGIATLALSAHPGLTVDQLYAILTDPAAALDCTSAAGNPDTDCGVGFSQADRVVSEAQDTSPPVVTPTVSPDGPYRAGGWYHSPVGVTWTVSDPESVVYSKSGCDPVTVSTDGIANLSCNAASIGGSISSPVTIKYDASPPTAPRLTGIAARAYAPSRLPSKKKIHCLADDPDSGIAGCKFSGYSRRPGRHTLRATATDNAGLSSSSTLRYRVLPVISRLRLGTASLTALLRSGLPLSVHVAGPRTTLKVTLTSLDRKGLVLGTLTKKKVKAGTAKLSLKLSKKGGSALRGRGQAKVKVAVLATSAGVKTRLTRRATLTR